MKLMRWITVIFAAALPMGALPSAALAQVPYEQLPKVFDASVPSEQQISIALSAGPEGVRDKATVYVLGPKGYEKAREGSNGVSCLVGRHFVKPTETTIEPMCYDPEGTQAFLPVELYREELRAKGTSEAEIKTDVAHAYKDGRFKAPSKPGVLYMLSSDNRLGPTPDHGTVHIPGHFMFYAPFMTGKDFGYDSAAPFLVQPGEPGAKMVVFPDPNLKGTI
ncbi:MAG: hypothetical protein WCA00_22150 [Candidatus Acidiferrales bacterium]